MPETLSALAVEVLEELQTVFAGMRPGATDGLIEAIVTASRIVVYGCGREGLQMRGFAMRLYHMGRNVSVWGDMTMPPVGVGDLLIVSAGPGYLATVEVLVEIARSAGARTALVTAQSAPKLAHQVDIVVIIPAQTMAEEDGKSQSVLPMGSLFECAQMIFFEIVVLKLRPRFAETFKTMRQRHTNLE